MKSKEEILEAYDYDKGAPHWVTKKAAIKAMQAYADQQVNRVLDEAIKAVDGIVSRGGEVEALLDVYEILESLKIKQP